MEYAERNERTIAKPHHHQYVVRMDIYSCCIGPAREAHDRFLGAVS